MLTARDPSTSVVDGKIYAFGGSNNSSPYLGFSIVEEYDPATDSWISKTPMPTARFGSSASTVNGKIYVIGGRDGASGTTFSTVEEYDPVTDTWDTTKQDMPTARLWLSTSVVKGKIYAIGGERLIHGGSLSTVEEYDPVTDTWTTKTNMPTARYGLSTSVFKGKIYTITTRGCDCYDAYYRAPVISDQPACKHQVAVWLVKAAEKKMAEEAQFVREERGYE